LIEKASRDNHLFINYLQPKLDGLRHQFDLKYWPDLSDIVRELSLDALESDVAASDSITEAATDSIRPSSADYLKALFAAINENSRMPFGSLPPDLHITDNPLATIINCALALDSESMVNAPYVKRIRQRIRDEAMTKKLEAAANWTGL
jgi:hypothetical protein